jgi:hypothetical protein
MTDYTILDTDTLLPDEPITSAQGFAFYENPIAIAEGAEDAPKIAIKTAGGSVASGNLNFTAIGDFSGVLIHGHFTADANVRTLDLSVSDDDTTYYGTVAIVSQSAGGTWPFVAFVDFATGAYKCSHGADGTAAYISGTIVGASLDITAVRLTVGSSCTVSAIVMPNGGESAS